MELFLEGYGQEVCRIWKAELYCMDRILSGEASPSGHRLW